jgi:hypothetical protein
VRGVSAHFFCAILPTFTRFNYFKNKRVKTIKTLIFLAVALSFVSCKTKMEITSNYDKSANFGNFNTFSFTEPSQGDMHFFEEKYPKIVNEENINRLKESIIKEMELKGYVLSGNGDLWVTYLVLLQTNTILQSSTISAGTTPTYYGYWGTGWGGVGGENIISTNSRSGSLVINIVDSKTNNVVWFGNASGAMSANPSKSYQNIPIRVKEIFSKYLWVAGQSEPVMPPPAH